MGARTRRFVAMIAVLAFLIVYIWAAVAIGERLPDNFLVELLYYAVVGTAWGVPLYPLFRWAERG